MVFKPVAGLHVYVDAPDAVNCVDWPSQMVLTPLTIMLSEGVTVSCVITILSQPETLIKLS